MKEQKTINLPFVETLSRSFMYTLCNWELYLRVVAVGIIAVLWEMFNGFPVLCSFSNADCVGGAAQSISSLLILLISVGIIVNYCRAIILKAPIDFRSDGFFKRVLLYIWTSFLLMLAIVVPFVLATLLYGMILGLFGINADVGNITYLFSVVVLVAWCICLAPIFLVFAAITVDDKSMTVKQAYALCKGNFNKIFWGQTLLMIPVAVVVYLLALLYQAMGVESYVIKFIFMVLALALSFLDSCFKASFFAHIYQYFTFYKDK